MPARLLKLASPKAVYIGITVIVVLLGLLGTAGWQLFDAYKQIGSGEVSLSQCVEDNRYQTQRLTETRDTLSEMVATLALDRQLINDRLLASQQRDSERARASAAERRARDQIYAEVPACETWRQQFVCPEIADRLIQRRSDLQQRWEAAPP